MLELIQVDQGYGRSTIVKGVTASIDGQCTGLLGPNGAGKTTLMRTMATIMPPKAGTVRLCGHEIRNERDLSQARRQIGFLPQHFGFVPGFTVTDFVAYCAWLRRVPKQQAAALVREAIARVGLEEVANRKMKSLSGGMLRRAGIATAIVGNPKLLLFDEPTVGLDPMQRLEFRQLLRELDDATIIISTHLVEDVMACCDRVIVLGSGRSVFDGTPAGLAGCGDATLPGDNEIERGYVSVLRSAVSV